MLHKVLLVVQAILSGLLIVAILLQQKGAGLGMAFGGSSNIYTTKRGFDKVLYTATIVLAILFFSSVLAAIIFP